MKNTKEMTRTEIVFELARHAHPTWYHSLLGWETYHLRELLAYYRGERDTLPSGLPRIFRTKGLGDTPNPRETAKEPCRRIALLIRDSRGNRHVRITSESIIVLPKGHTLIRSTPLTV